MFCKLGKKNPSFVSRLRGVFPHDFFRLTRITFTLDRTEMKKNKMYIYENNIPTFINNNQISTIMSVTIELMTKAETIINNISIIDEKIQQQFEKSPFAALFESLIGE
jgi:hypothetical protein